MRRKSGFTLVELLLTSAIFVILTLIITTVFSNSARLLFANRYSNSVGEELQLAQDYIQEVIERAVNVDPNYAPYISTSGGNQCVTTNCSQPNNVLFLYTRTHLSDGTLNPDPNSNEWTVICTQTGNNSRRQLEILTIQGDIASTPTHEHMLGSPPFPTNPANGTTAQQNNCGRIEIPYYYYPDINPLVVYDGVCAKQSDCFAPDTVGNSQFINQKLIDIENLRFYPIYTNPAGSQPIGWTVEITAQTDLRNFVGLSIRPNDEKAAPGYVSVRFNAYRLNPNYINRTP